MIFELRLFCEQHAINEHFLMCLFNRAIFCQSRASRIVSFVSSMVERNCSSFLNSDDASSIKTANQLHMTRLLVARYSKSECSILSQQPRNTQKNSTISKRFRKKRIVFDEIDSHKVGLLNSDFSPQHAKHK